MSTVNPDPDPDTFVVTSPFVLLYPVPPTKVAASKLFALNLLKADTTVMVALLLVESIFPESKFPFTVIVSPFE